LGGAVAVDRKNALQHFIQKTELHLIIVLDTQVSEAKQREWKTAFPHYTIHTDPARSGKNREPGCISGCAIFLRKPQKEGDLALSLNNLITGKEISPHWEGRCVAGEITLNRYTQTNQAGEKGIEDTLWICGYYNHCNEEEQMEYFPQMGEFLRTGLRPTEKNNSNEAKRKKAETQHKRKCHLVLCDGNGHWDQSDIGHLTPITGQSQYKYFFRSCMENLPHLTNISRELTPEKNPEDILDRPSKCFDKREHVL
jgi:hypothetical protein